MRTLTGPNLIQSPHEEYRVNETLHQLSGFKVTVAWMS